VDDNKFAEF